MKQLTCEMCGSNDLIKQNGVFVCQTCGCKYSVEEAKKMMIEGTVDVRGTVQIDNTAFVEKYLANARRAKEKEDWEETEKYYNLVEQNDPNNIEAIFYSAYGKARLALLDNDIYKRQAAFKVLKNCISIIDDRYQIEKNEENQKVIENMASDLSTLFLSDFVFTIWKNGNGIVTKTDRSETYELFANLVTQFRESILNISKIDNHVYLHTSLQHVYNSIMLSSDVWTAGFKYRVKLWAEEAENNIKKARLEQINRYWLEHQSEKKQLDDEKNSLQAEISNLKKTVDTLPEVITINEAEAKIEVLMHKLKTIGVLQFIEKKSLQKQINDLTETLISAKSKRDVLPVWQEFSKLSTRMEEIDEELTRDR